MTFYAWLSLAVICLLGAIAPGPSLAVLVAVELVPAYYTHSSAVALALICFGLFATQTKGAVFFTLPTALLLADRLATVWGVFGAAGSLGGGLLGLLAGFMALDIRVCF